MSKTLFLVVAHTQFFSRSFKAICMPAAPPPRRHLYYCRGNSRFAPTVFLQRSSFSLRLRRNNRSSQITTTMTSTSGCLQNAKQAESMRAANDRRCSILISSRAVKDQESRMEEVLTELQRDAPVKGEHILGGFLHASNMLTIQ